MTVVIDAGHGGKDPGNLGTGRYRTVEKDITLAVALKTAAYIEERIPDVRVIMTRTGDTYPTLPDRVNMANDNQADLLLELGEYYLVCGREQEARIRLSSALTRYRNLGVRNWVASTEASLTSLSQKCRRVNRMTEANGRVWNQMGISRLASTLFADGRIDCSRVPSARE